MAIHSDHNRPWRAVPEILLDCAAYRRDQLVLVEPGRARVTAAELLAATRRGAHLLRRHGVRRGDFVGVDTTMLGWSDATVSYLSVVWLGAVAVLTAGAAAERVAQERIGPGVWLGGRAGGQLTPADIQAEPGAVAEPAEAVDDRLDIVFTSGTTGDPKPVLSTHAQWVGAVRPELLRRAVPKVVGHTGIPIAVSGGVHGVVLTHLARGVTSVCARDVGELRSAGAGAGVSELHLTPHAAQALVTVADEVRAWSGQVKTIRVVGGPVTAGLAAGLATTFPDARVVSMYGLTEGGAAVCVRQVEPGRGESIGRPAPGTEVRVLDPRGAEAPPGQVGELAVRTTGSASPRYFREESLNRRQFSGEWVRTGDMAVVGADGEVRLVGRAKELIMLKGGRVGPETVEEILARRIPAGVEFAVAGIPTPGTWDRIAVFLAGRETEPELVQARQELERMRGPFRPSLIRTVPCIPRGPFDKPLRAQLVRDLVPSATAEPA